MKKYLFQLLALAMLGGLTACGSDDNEGSTTPPPSPGPEFALTIDDVTSASVTLTVTPENPELTYYYDIATRSDYDAYNGDVARFVQELIEFLTSSTGQTVAEAVQQLQKTGTQSETISGLPSSTEFVAFVVGLDDEGNCTTEAVTQTFATEEAGEPSACSFTFEYPSVLAESAYVRITPSDPSVRYFYISIPASTQYTDKELTTEVRDIMLQISSQYGTSLAEVIQTLTYTGVHETLEEELTPETGYISYAYAMNTATGEAEGDVYRGEFTTASSGTATDFSVRATNIRWFKGSELAELDSKYEAIRDGASLMADIVTEGNPKEWYIALSAGDQTNAEEYPDDSVITAIMMGGITPNKTSTQLAVQYGDATFLGFAVDQLGQTSSVYREKVEITEEGASPISEFTGSALDARMLPTMSEWLAPGAPNQGNIARTLQYRYASADK